MIIRNGYISIQGGWLSQGALIALINYLLQILVELIKLAMLINSLNQSYISAKRIKEVFAEKPEDILAEIAQKETSSNQSLQVEHLSFTYPDAAQPSLQNLSFAMQQGQILGIIGGTGSGKSSLVQLIPRLYDVESGSVKVAGQDVRNYDLDYLRKQVAMVLRPMSFSLVRLKKICAGGNKDATDEEIVAAAKAANVDHFIRTLPGGYNMEMNQESSNISLGQKQLLTIARALLKKAPFLILDDSTSALDYLTEARLLKSIKEELSDTSLILVSQRTNSLKSADQILVLNKGHQVGLGKSRFPLVYQ